MYNKIKTADEINSLRQSGHILAETLQLLKTKLRPGMTTKDLAALAKENLDKTKGTPAFLGYYGFPDVLCVSINDEVVHGIPSSKRVIQEGDIVSMDFGVAVNGMITDAAISVIAGSGDEVNKHLVEQTYWALMNGISVVKDGCKVGDIANAVESSLDKKYGIVRDLVGHGVGHELHEEPNIPNYGRKNTGPKLLAGMTIAIEPMINLGTEKVYTDVDGWTIKTNDGTRSAHFEHTILITDDGYEILTEVK